MQTTPPANTKFPVLSLLTGLISSHLVRYHYLVRNLHMVPKCWSGGAGSCELRLPSILSEVVTNELVRFYHILLNMITVSVPHRM
jgi:hypothetical protein